MRFSDWQNIDEPNELTTAAGLFQLRLKEGLLDYPTGKSAMFYYGYCENLQAGWEEFRTAILPKLERSGDELLFRTMPAADYEQRFRSIISKFAQNFGSLPAGNEIYLAILNSSG